MNMFMQGKHYIHFGPRTKEEQKKFELEIFQGPSKLGKYKATFGLRESPHGLLFGEPIIIEFFCREPPTWEERLREQGADKSRDIDTEEGAEPLEGTANPDFKLLQLKKMTEKER